MMLRPTPETNRRASALIICLLILVLISALLLGFVGTARVEIVTSRTHSAGFEATQYARMGSESVRAQLRLYTGDTYRWITQPGRLIAQPLSGTNPEPVEVPLSSGIAAGVVADESVDLNPTGFVTNRGLIESEEGDPLPAIWKYVARDGTLHDTLPPFDKDNPVVGRYAYWADDESTRLNWNTAWKRGSGNAAPLNHPSQIDLTAIPDLTATVADLVHDHRQNTAPFSTTRAPLDLGNATLSTLVQDQGFLFTHYNHAPELSLFGTERIRLTTRADRAGDPAAPDISERYLSILADESADPGLKSNVDLAKLNDTFRRICALLRRSDWPGAEGLSFVQKYGESTSIQIALNIIEYVRSVESSLMCVEPLMITTSGSVASGTVQITKLHPGPDVEYQYLGNTRGPRIIEMGVHVDPTPDSDGFYTCTLLVKAYNPAGSGMDIDLSKLKLYYPTTLIHPFGSDPYTSTTAPVTAAMIVNAASIANPLIMKPGESRVLQRSVKHNRDAANPGPPPRQFYLKAGLFTIAGNAILEFIPYTYRPRLDYTATIGPALTEIETRAVEDPIVNRSLDSWKPAAPNTLFSAPVVGTPDALPIQQDTDATGAIDPSSVYASVGPPTGIVRSVAELGRIHSGLQGTLGEGTPWRTLRLQPRSNTTTLPDWFLLDAFCAPAPVLNAADQEIVTPYNESIAGRFNLNHHLYSLTGFPDRRPALQAWLKGTAGEAAETAIVNQTLATSPHPGRFYGDPFFSTEKLYITPASLAEIQGLATQGETSEAALHGLIDLATTRSNVFSVYAVGQSVRQTANGVFVQGERRLQTILERRADGSVRIVSERSLGL